MDGLRRERTRRPPSTFAGQLLGGRTRTALVVVNGAVTGLCVCGVYFVIMFGAEGHTAAVEEMRGWMWMMIAVLCVAAGAFGAVTWQVYFNRRWPLGWPVVAGAALAVLVILGLNAPPGFWPVL